MEISMPERSGEFRIFRVVEGTGDSQAKAEFNVSLLTLL